ncbi:MAG: hypothetical protein ACKVQR_07195 [Aquabacterium sp.]
MQLAFSDTFDISVYGGKLFSAAPLKLDYSLDMPDVETATPEGTEAQKLVKAAWEAKMASWKKDKEKEYKSILKATEEALLSTAKKKAPEFLKATKGDKALAANKLMQWLSEEAKGANVMIKNALTTFEGVCQKFMVDLWNKVAATIDKKFKSQILKTQVKAVLKIIGLSIVIVAAAALTVAGAILAALAAPTGIGIVAGLGLAAGGVATIAGAIAQIYGVVDKVYPDHKKAAKTLRDKVLALSDALTYEETKSAKQSRGDKLGPKERVKLLLGNVKGKKKDVEDALKHLQMYTGKMLLDIEKGGKAEQQLSAKLDELEEVLKTATDPKQVAEVKQQHAEGIKKITQQFNARENARLYLKRYTAMSEEASALLLKPELVSAASLGKLASKLSELMASPEMDTLITIGKGTAEFMKGFLKFAAK